MGVPFDGEKALARVRIDCLRDFIVGPPPHPAKSATMDHVTGLREQSELWVEILDQFP